MKLTNLLLTGTSAALAYLAVSHRKKIQEELSETQNFLKEAKTSYQTIQEKLAIIQSYKEPIQEMAEELQYKSKVFQEESQVRLKEIKKIQEKYTSPDKESE
ncbi:hypothetical protein ACVR1I_01400 [Streptococcus cameli]